MLDVLPRIVGRFVADIRGQNPFAPLQGGDYGGHAGATADFPERAPDRVGQVLRENRGRMKERWREDAGIHPEVTPHQVEYCCTGGVDG